MVQNRHQVVDIFILKHTLQRLFSTLSKPSATKVKKKPPPTRKTRKKPRETSDVPNVNPILQRALQFNPWNASK
jgi:hypothetical protein